MIVTISGFFKSDEEMVKSLGLILGHNSTNCSKVGTISYSFRRTKIPFCFWLISVSNSFFPAAEANCSSLIYINYFSFSINTQIRSEFKYYFCLYCSFEVIFARSLRVFFMTGPSKSQNFERTFLIEIGEGNGYLNLDCLSSSTTISILSLRSNLR